ncbi:MAG: cation:proton antiporter [Planctomyces sp.]|nr:cation:proton antiporter [Planctomyces sp.]
MQMDSRAGRRRRPRFVSVRSLPVLLILLAAAYVFGQDAAPDAAGPPLTGEVAQTAADDHANGHHDPVTPLLVGLSLILAAAKIGGAILVRFRQPAVLGELLVGVIMGNLVLLGPTVFEFLRPASADHPETIASAVSTTVDMLARIGVILLLFEVGLESNLGDMRRVGLSAFLVAILGVLAPFGLGWGVGKWLLPEESWHVHLFLGATLCATSVGITARVLKDLGKTDAKESQIILGAAVIDDVLGLIVLAVVQAIILNGSASLAEVAIITGKAFAFLVGAVVLGEFLFPRMYTIAARLKVHGMLVVTGLVVCFLLSWIAGLVGLAPIVGAFAAGLILDERHYAPLRQSDEGSLEDWVIPITTLLVPIFFVMMGFQVDLRSFANPSVLLLAAAITIAAVIGKQVCSLGVVERGVDRLSVGFGMIPRGEVGLIFAAIGRGLHTDGHAVISESVYTAIVVMVMVTTLVTPPLLGWSMTRRSEEPSLPA